eukprot:SAG31_NODE_19672_length_595_cov_0.715726_1_plen_162_part_10
MRGRKSTSASGGLGLTMTYSFQYGCLNQVVIEFNGDTSDDAAPPTVSSSDCTYTVSNWPGELTQVAPSAAGGPPPPAQEYPTADVIAQTLSMEMLGVAIKAAVASPTCASAFQQALLPSPEKTIDVMAANDAANWGLAISSMGLSTDTLGTAWSTYLDANGE